VKHYLTHPDNICPRCKYKAEMATKLTDKKGGKPVVGDWTVCIQCGAFLRFGIDMRLATTTVAELMEFRKNQRKEYAKMLMASRFIISGAIHKYKDC
jgi:hypothetical protein